MALSDYSRWQREKQGVPKPTLKNDTRAATDVHTYCGRTVCITHLEVLGIKIWGVEGRGREEQNGLFRYVEWMWRETLPVLWHLVLMSYWTIIVSIRLEKQGRAGFFCFGIFLTLSVFLPSTLCSPRLAFLLGNCQQAYCNNRSNPLLPDQGIPDVTWWRHFVIIPTVPAEGSEIPWKTNKQNKNKIKKKVNFSLKPSVLFVCFSFFTYLAKDKKDQYKNPNVFSSLLFTWTAQKPNSACRHS